MWSWGSSARHRCAASANAPAFKRCRNAIFQKRTMPNESLKAKPEKLPKTKTELEALVLAELRAASQYGGAVHVTVVAYATIAWAPPGRGPDAIRANRAGRMRTRAVRHRQPPPAAF